MASLEKFTSVSSRQVYFEETLTRLVSYWLEHKALKGVDVERLDEERENISRTISLTLDMPNVWESTRNLMKAFSNYLERYGHQELWQSLIIKTIEAAKKQQDLNAEAELLNALARLCIYQGKLYEAVRFSRRASCLAKAVANRYEEAMAYSYLGFCFVEIGHLGRAEVFCCTALNIFEQLKSQHGLALTHQNLACLYTEQNKFHASERHFKTACHFWEELDDTFYLVFAYNNLGHLYSELEQFDQAIIFLHKALNKAKSLGQASFISVIEQVLGHTYFMQGNLVLAELYLRSAERVIKTSGDAVSLVQLMRDLGGVFKAKKEFASASKCFEIAAAHLQELKIWRILAAVRISIAECQLLLEDYDNCLKHLHQSEQVLLKLSTEIQEKIRPKADKVYDALREKGLL